MADTQTGRHTNRQTERKTDNADTQVDKPR